MGKKRKEPPGLGWVQFRKGRKPGWVRKDGMVFTGASGVSKGAWHRVKANGLGYRFVEDGGKRKQVARVVLEQFVGPCPEGCSPDHIDRDRENNAVENLRWATIVQQNANTGRCKGVEYRRLGEQEWKCGSNVEYVRKELGIAHDAGIYACLRGRLNHTAGFEFRRPTERDEPIAVAADENAEEHVSKKARVE